MTQKSIVQRSTRFKRNDFLRMQLNSVAFSRPLCVDIFYKTIFAFSLDLLYLVSYSKHIRFFLFK